MTDRLKASTRDLLPVGKPNCRIASTVVAENTEDSALRKLLQVIVQDFDGDTSAFFESIQPDSDLLEKKRVRKEINIAQRFTKTV